MTSPNEKLPGARYRDALLWIGGSYVDILCSHEPPEHSDYCYLDDRKRRCRCYVHEAEARGCCRKVPMVPEWIEPGASRIFLVHRGGHTDPGRGSIFGYFKVRRVEMITDAAVPEGLKQGKLPWSGALFREVAYPVLRHLTREPENEEVREGSEGEDGGEEPGEAEIRERTREEFEKRKRDLVRHLGDATTVSPPSRRRETQDQDVLELIEDVLKECIEDWMESEGKGEMDEGEGDLALVPISVSQLETHRSCSKRLKIGGRYLVDDLTASITNEFLALTRAKNSTVKEGEARFREVVARARRPFFEESTLPKCLPKHAAVRGALVLFPKPYPVLERQPAAAFRGLLRIDGDHLLDALCECWSKGVEPCIPRIDYWNQGEDREAVEYTAARGVTKATARAVLMVRDLLAGLDQGESVYFPNVGRLEARGGTFAFIK